MTILNNSEIRSLVSTSGLIADTDDDSFQPCSYDMRIGTIFRDGQVINQHHARNNEQISLKPGEVITMTTLETLKLPENIAGTAYAINAQSSEGLLVLNPGHVDPGYEGYLTVMAVNMRRVPYVVSLKDKIFTIVFQRLENAAVPAYKSSQRPRSDKERDLNKKVVEKAVSSLADLIAINAPFTKPEDVNRQIRVHWATVTTMIAAFLTLFASLVAATFAVFAVLHVERPTATLASPLPTIQASPAIAPKLEDVARSPLPGAASAPSTPATSNPRPLRRSQDATAQRQPDQGIPSNKPEKKADAR